MNATARISARPIAAADSCIISTSPAKPHSKLAGIWTVATARSTSAVMSPSAAPAARSTPTLACRRRCSRSMLLGPTAGVKATTSPVRTTDPLGE